jgi:hypothetical protein
LQRVTTKVGMATLMTNLTTAIGFYFVASNNQLLLEFEWLHPSISWHFFFVHYCDSYFHSYIPAPKERHIEHLIAIM